MADNPLKQPNDPADGGKIVHFAQAAPKGLHVLSNFVGFSSCGKTYSALRFARGLVGAKGRIALSDTENERALFYSDVASPWDHDDFNDPFTPQRYVARIKAAEAAGYAVHIIDSASHEWEAEGGVLEMAEAIDIQGLGKWREPKMRHKKFLRAIQRSRLHVICCLRAKDKYTQEGKGKGATLTKAERPAAVQDPRFIYDCTVQLLFDDPEQAGKPIVVKCPEALLAAFGVTGQGERTPRQVDEEMGKAVARWCAGRIARDDPWEKLKNEGRECARLGAIALRDWFTQQSKADQDRIKREPALIDDLRNTAAEADRATAERALHELSAEDKAALEEDDKRLAGNGNVEQPFGKKEAGNG